MKHSKHTKAFTLVEIIVAVAIVVTIASAICGTYAAAAHATTRAAAHARLNQQARTLVEKITAQLRSTFPQNTPASQQKQPSTELASALPKQQLPPSLQANTSITQTDLLRLVTTASLVTDTKLPKGPFVARYRHDPARQRLLYHQSWLAAVQSNNSSRLSDAKHSLRQNSPPPSQWTPLAQNVKNITLTFWDGNRYQNQWNSHQQKCLPLAVKIDLALTDHHANINKTWTATVCLTTASHAAASQNENSPQRPRS